MIYKHNYPLSILTKDYFKLNFIYMETIIGLKTLRENMSTYVNRVKKGTSFLVMRRSEPVFKIVPPTEENQWERVVDFTKIKPGGIRLSEVLAHL